MNELEIRVNVGNNCGLFLNNKNELDIANEWELLSNYPVTIEILKHQDEEMDDESNGEVVATLNGIFFDIEYIENFGIPLFEIFDSIDQSVYELYEALFKGDWYKEEFEIYNPNLFYLTDISVKDKEKDRYYREILINNLDDILKYVAKLNVGLIATEAYIVAEDDESNDDSILEAKGLLVDNDYIFATEDENYLIKEIL